MQFFSGAINLLKRRDENADETIAGNGTKFFNLLTKQTDHCLSEAYHVTVAFR